MLVYHDDYSFDMDDLLGELVLHTKVPFDTQRYSKIHKFLKDNGLSFMQPEMANNVDLSLVHTNSHLTWVHHPEELAHIYELPILSEVSPSKIEKYVVKSILLSVGGSIMASQLALQHGWAINLSGGYHHAKIDSGNGSCPYSDIGIVIKKLWQQQPMVKVMIIDLDAHQGSGYAEIFKHEDRVIIFDIYNDSKYPAMFHADVVLRERINFNYPVKSGITDQPYMEILYQHLPRALSESTPDYIIYNAGYDVIKYDPYGGMKLTDKGIIQRDEYIFRMAEERHIPILMLISGGYSPEGTNTTGQSILNIVTKKRQCRAHPILRMLSKYFSGAPVESGAQSS